MAHDTELIDRAVDLYQSGKSLRQVAAQISRSRWWVGEALKNKGVTARSHRRDDLCVETIVKQYLSNVTVQDIAQSNQANVRTITRIIELAGVLKPPAQIKTCCIRCGKNLIRTLAQRDRVEWFACSYSCRSLHYQALRRKRKRELPGEIA